MTDLALALGSLRLTHGVLLGIFVLVLAVTLGGAWWLHVTREFWRGPGAGNAARHKLPEWEFDRDGQILLTQHLEPAAGYRDGELAGTSIWVWVAPGSPGERAYRAAIGGGVAGRADIDFPAKGGGRCVWRCYAIPTASGGVHAVGIDVLDLIERIERAEARADLAEQRVAGFMVSATDDARRLLVSADARASAEASRLTLAP